MYHDFEFFSCHLMMEEPQVQVALLGQAGVHSGSHKGDSLLVLQGGHQGREDLQVPEEDDLQVHLAVPCASEDNILPQVGPGSRILDSLPAGEDSCQVAGHIL